MSRPHTPCDGKRHQERLRWRNIFSVIHTTPSQQSRNSHVFAGKWICQRDQLPLNIKICTTSSVFHKYSSLYLPLKHTLLTFISFSLYRWHIFEENFQLSISVLFSCILHSSGMALNMKGPYSRGKKWEQIFLLNGEYGRDLCYVNPWRV